MEAWKWPSSYYSTYYGVLINIYGWTRVPFLLAAISLSSTFRGQIIDDKMTRVYTDSVVNVVNVGNNTGSQINFPSDPFFTKLLARANRLGNLTIINDNTISAQVSYLRLLQDVNNLRQSLRRRLPPGLLDNNGTLSAADNGTCIAVIARSGYRFLVACIAIFTLGGIILPLSEPVLTVITTDMLC
jgi:hypothetical protein